jgi:dihydroxy-acid dehydratase
VLADRIREGIRDAGGIALEFPTHPLQETGKRPNAGLDRNLAYLGLVELLYGYPFDGVVLTTGCDKTTPACLMAAATVDIPAIALPVGPMITNWDEGKRVGSGVVWKLREKLAAGELDYRQFIEKVAAASPSTGVCNTMGTAMTMASLAETLGMTMPGAAAIPAPHRDRQECAYRTGRQIVEMVDKDRKPSNVLTYEAFVNAIKVNSAIGGSTNAPIHLNAIARHIGVDLSIEDWERHGRDVPLLVNVQPAGEYLAEDFYRAGGVPAVIAELLRGGYLDASALTVNGLSLGDNCRSALVKDSDVIRPVSSALATAAGFKVLRGNLFDSAIIKMSVISTDFRRRYLSNPADPEAFEGSVFVFDGPEDYRARIDDPELRIDETSILVIRGVGPIGYPGAAEVVNMRPPALLIQAGIHSLPCMGDGRQSGTSNSPSILNASPEAAIGGGLSLLQTGDRVRIDIGRGEVNLLLPDDELSRRRAEFEARGRYPVPPSQTPWQELQRNTVGQLESGAVLEFAVDFQRVAARFGPPRHSH